MNLPSVWLIITTALADSVNPCEIGILIMALSYVLLSQGKTKAITVGFIFSLSLGFSYFMFGLFSCYIFSYIKYIRIIVGLFAIAMAIPRLYYGIKGKELKLTPKPLRPIVSKNLRKASVINSIVAGLLAGIVLSPCSSGPYFTIISLLYTEILSQRLAAYALLALYNFVFIMPLIAITVVFYFVTDYEKVRKIKEKYIPTLEIVSSIILLAIGFYVLWIGIKLTPIYTIICKVLMK